ncbi:MAG: hypothetical protein AB7O96_11900 [Pseudobdellovibrionaceae bacterium]
MKALLTAMSLVLASTMAQAAGFECETEAGYKVKVYEHTQPEMGTRNAAIMVLSDSSVSSGRKTIARFTDSEGNLNSRSLIYASKVDLRFNNSERAGENFMGTKLGQIATIVLDVDFTYSAPLAHGEETTAKLIVLKRNGAQIREEVVCTRYLKN